MAVADIFSPFFGRRRESAALRDRGRSRRRTGKEAENDGRNGSRVGELQALFKTTKLFTHIY